MFRGQQCWQFIEVDRVQREILLRTVKHSAGSHSVILLRKNTAEVSIIMTPFLNTFYNVQLLGITFFLLSLELSIRGDGVHIYEVCAKQGCNWEKFFFKAGHFLCERWHLHMVVLFYPNFYCQFQFSNKKNICLQAQHTCALCK